MDSNAELNGIPGRHAERIKPGCIKGTGGDHHGPDLDTSCSFNPRNKGVCRGGTCDSPLRCNQANGCTYRSSADEFREAQRTPLATVSEVVRTFTTGANRDVDNGKLDYEGFLSPTVLRRFAEYMHKNRFLRDGSVRDSDNWQKGIPLNVYMKSMMRHFMACWLDHRLGCQVTEEELCALMFNVMGYLHQRLKGAEE